MLKQLSREMIHPSITSQRHTVLGVKNIKKL